MSVNWDQDSGGDGTDGRTIAANVFARLLPTWKVMKFIAMKNLKRRPISIISGLRTGHESQSHVNAEALPTRAFMVRYRQRICQYILRAIHGRRDVVRTKTIESVTCMFVLALSWCTRHNLTPIAAVYDNEWSVGGRR
jgi:hypothetical protein